MAYSKWTGKWALVTGASSGIGAAFAKELARSGVKVILVARRLERLEALGAELTSQFGIETACIASDLSTTGASTALMAELESRGLEVELLINNAGLGPAGTFVDETLESATTSIQVNITALTELTHLNLQKMKTRRSGAIVLVGSVNAFMSVPLFAVYSATKAYVRSFGEAIAEECRQHDVSVTVVHPGGTRTEFMDVAKMTVPKSMQTGLMTAEAVAQIGLRGAHRGQISVVTGWMNRLFAMLLSCIPRWITRPVVKWVYAKFI